MADMAKYASAIKGGALFTDFKAHLSIVRTKRTVSIAYAFVFIFIAFTIFLAFSPSSNSSSPWFANIFTVSDVADGSHGSRFSSVYYYFFSNSSAASGSQSVSQNTVSEPPRVESGNITNSPPKLPLNQTANPPDLPPKPPLNQAADKTANPPRPSPEMENRTQDTSQGEKSPLNQAVDKTANPPKPSPEMENRTQDTSQGEKSPPNQTVSKAANPLKPSPEMKSPAQNTSRGEKSGYKVAVLQGNSSAVAGRGEKGVMVNNSSTSSPQKKKQNSNGNSNTKSNSDLIKSLEGCDFFDGNWVKDESYPLYKPNSCPLIDEQFNCFRNGRPDNGYYKLKWKPKACTLPRLDGSHMLELLRGKRLVFVGDSLNRNMWESLICILRNSVKDQSKVYEENGRHHFRGEASYSFAFKDYKFTVEFFVTPFLVQEWEVAETNGTKKETLRLDIVSHAASKYKNADIIVFNTGHWWTHDKTALGKDYYQEGSHVYSDLNVLEAFRKAMTTWGRWVDANVNPKKSLVFFRGYSASHFSGGQWNSGGQCDHETEPIKNETYLSEYPPKMGVLENVLRNMKTPVTYMNVTRMTDYRKDGHPSIYRKLHLSDEERRSPLSFQDCSHWCLPGVPDAWNEILYAELLVKLSHKRT